MTGRRPPRPRDALGRPGPVDPLAAIERDPEPLPPDQTLRAAQQLLDKGRAFRAHEVLEARWKASTGEERALWRGLAQVAVAVTHAQRGNEHGRRALLQRAAATLEPWETRQPYGVDVAAVRAWAQRGADAPATAEALLESLPGLSSGRG